MAPDNDTQRKAPTMPFNSRSRTAPPATGKFGWCIAPVGVKPKHKEGGCRGTMTMPNGDVDYCQCECHGDVPEPKRWEAYREAAATSTENDQDDVQDDETDGEGDPVADADTSSEDH